MKLLTLYGGEGSVAHCWCDDTNVNLSAHCITHFITLPPLPPPTPHSMFLSVILYFVEVVPLKEGDKSQECDGETTRRWQESPGLWSHHSGVTRTLVSPQAHDGNMTTETCFQYKCKKRITLSKNSTMILKFVSRIHSFWDAQIAAGNIWHIVKVAQYKNPKNKTSLY